MPESRSPLESLKFWDSGLQPPKNRDSGLRLHIPAWQVLVDPSAVSALFAENCSLVADLPGLFPICTPPEFDGLRWCNGGVWVNFNDTFWFRILDKSSLALKGSWIFRACITKVGLHHLIWNFNQFLKNVSQAMFTSITLFSKRPSHLILCRRLLHLVVDTLMLSSLQLLGPLVLCRQLFTAIAGKARLGTGIER